MRRLVLLLCLILVPFPDAAFAFISIERMPYSLRDLEGFTSYWNESYLLTVDDMQLRLVAGTAEVSSGTAVGRVNWDPEIVSVKIDGEEIMRRVAIVNADYIDNDPLIRLPFLGIGGLVPSYNYVKGQSPPSSPPADMAWTDIGERGLLGWTSAYRYEPGDVMLWLNRTFILNSSLGVECRFQVASEYTAIEQQIKVTNGEAAQYLPFPMESAFSLGSRLKARGISLPNMTLSSDRYFTYPRDALPSSWYNESTGIFTLPGEMWDEPDLPGMLYVEFDIAERDWFGMCALTTYGLQTKMGVGVKVVSADMPKGFRPYCIFVSGESDHLIIGFKPFEVAGVYDDFMPLTLAPHESVSLDLLWFFPQAKGDTMSISDLAEFGNSTLTVSDFHANRTKAEVLFAQANELAAEGRVEEAIEKAEIAIGVYEDLGVLSDALFEEGSKINATIHTWRNAAANPTPHPDRGSRAGILFTTAAVLSLIVAVAVWVYFIEPRRASKA